MTGENHATIELRDIVKRFGRSVAVAGINLTISSGEFVVIMGPSGCGKTTTLRMIAGLELPDSGDILIDSKRVNDLKPWERETPLVWQNFALFPHLSVSQNVEYGLSIRGVKATERRQRATRILETVGLTGFGDRDVTKLSGGQKQRVGLARALVLDPKILLLDEPLGALDAKIARQMQQELRRLHQMLGITFVYVTHNQSEALSLADRIVIMNGGRILQIGAPHELFRKPTNRFVAEFMGANNILAGKVVSMDGDDLKVETANGNFIVPNFAQQPVRVGDSVTFVVAADHLIPSRSSGVLHNRLLGRVINVEIMGSLFSLYLAMPDGKELQVHLPAALYDLSSFDIGSNAEFHWDKSNSHLLVGD